ncbi:sulfite oxidase-like oxidoreductase [Candidatus Entotheonella palauensis]|uniref:Oxidoreductase n=1 Tax=Candidatus Entotheonella gemina TaxID=1429439 RepID=W4M852_9BACT|nr:sulfite oxidase-like oxidoreductase [Candidatus Entotheonella palauensis]ETX06375.1 MAG: oxidoreductase [Candidatus Entotheonella gemina]
MALPRWLTRKARVPAGQHVVSMFPVLHVGPVPPFDPATWSFKVFGLVQEEKAFTYKELTSGALFPISTVAADFHCVTSWSRLDNVWGGIKFVDLLDHLDVSPKAHYVMVHCEYGYTTNLPLADLKRPETLLAWQHNGSNLDPDHGYPLRLVVPHLYGWKSAKWLRGLEFMAANEPGYWEQRGYHPYGDPWRQQRYSWDG